jgi:5-(carboxyamino)imidazole ribonucleotide mutase
MPESELKIAKGSLVGVIMGSKSDYRVMFEVTSVFSRIGMPFDVKIISAHRTPELVPWYVKAAEEAGIEVIVAGAGGSAQ